MSKMNMRKKRRIRITGYNMRRKGKLIHVKSYLRKKKGKKIQK